MTPAEIDPALPRLVGAGVVDARIAALAWLLLEDGIPVLVAVSGHAGDGSALLDGLVAALPAERRPEAVSPGEQRPDPASPGGGTAAGRVVRVPETLSIATPPGRLRAALSTTTGRSSLAATVEAPDLAAVLAVLRRQGLSDDEISFLGVVLVLGRNGAAADEGSGRSGEPGIDSGPARIRVVAAHYLRPVARDSGGHVQRLGPAVLATWDPRRVEYDHFAWGIYPELAARTGRRAGDLEREHQDREEQLRSAVERGPV